jgi:ABC-type multidrug transport system permease subunit
VNLFLKFIYWSPFVVAVAMLLVINVLFFLVLWGTIVGLWHFLDYVFGAVIFLGDFFVVRILYKVYRQNAR